MTLSEEPRSTAPSQISSLRQGDILQVKELPILGNSEYPTALPHGAAIISQTCDIVLPTRPNLIIAAVVQLSGNDARLAAGGLQPRYVHLAAHKENMFADLEHIATISKESLYGIPADRGVDQASDRAVRAFSLATGRRFSRFAFPDAVVPWLKPLQDSIKDKYAKLQSPLGKAMKHVEELRLEANWQEHPLDLTLHVIVKSGVLPEAFGNPISANLQVWLNSQPNIVEIARYICRSELGIPNPPAGDDKSHLWWAFTESLAEQCQPKEVHSSDETVMQAVKSISGVLSSVDEFTLAQYRRSESLDLDHLSHPVPYQPQQ